MPDWLPADNADNDHHDNNHGKRNSNDDPLGL